MAIFNSYVSLPEGIYIYIKYPALLGWSVDPDDPSVSQRVPDRDDWHHFACAQARVLHSLAWCLRHGIGWWENFNRKALYLMVKTMGFRLRFSLKPIHWLRCRFWSAVEMLWKWHEMQILKRNLYGICYPPTSVYLDKKALGPLVFKAA